MDEAGFLILGANGQLGRALRAKYPKAPAVDSKELDITDPLALQNYDWSNVSVILNAAAYTNVDGAETPEGRVEAWRVNAQAVGYLAEVARQNNLTLVHISTDYVFDGTKSPHTEDESLSPLGTYGASKAAGEITVTGLPKHYLLRASWVIGDGKNFVRTMLELGKKDTNPTVVADQIGRPTFTTELVRAIDHLLTRNSPFGLYNITNGGDAVSWADLTREIFKLSGYNLTVTNTTTAEYFASKDNVAPRPLNSVFDLAKIESTGFKATDWHQDLENYIKKELSK